MTEDTNTPSDPADDLVTEELTQEVKPPVLRDGNCFMEEEYSSPKGGADDSITLPSDTARKTRDAIAAMPNLKTLDNPDSRKWASVLSDGIDKTMNSNVLGDMVSDQSKTFQQTVTHNGFKINAQQAKFKTIENEQIKGERAVIRAITHLGLGGVVHIPLWHTGIWVTIKPPSEAELIELNRIMLNDKIRFGRATHSLAFSNTTSYTTDRLVDFALSHVYDTTLQSPDIDTDMLKNVIVSQDIPSLIWGLMCSVYPRGFKYQRACVADPEKCNFVIDETLNLSKIQYVNSEPLTEWQKSHMASKQAKSKDLESVKRYKAELSAIQNKLVTVVSSNGSNIKFTLKTPSIKEYIDAGHVWISDMVETMEKSVTAETGVNEREALLTKYAQASAMRQYRHWVDSIELDTNTIVDPETVSSCLNFFSSEDTILNGFIKEVITYIGESTIAVIGIPVFDCPSCGKRNEEKHKLPRHVNIIPLDTITVFFALYTQRLARLTER
jgi:hypothetical protein